MNNAIANRTATGYADSLWRSLLVRSRKWLHELLLHPRLTRLYDRWNRRQQLSLGAKGELAAERFLLRQGYIIVGRNYEDWFGEIDLIAVNNRTVVFVEVKTRRDDQLGMPYEAVDQTKQEKIVKTAIGFLKQNQLTECRVRFDVISILWENPESSPAIDHYQSAFEPSASFQMF